MRARRSISGKAPHVAHILPYPNIGGTEVSQLRSMEAARSLGFANTVFHLDDAPLVRDYFASAGFEVAPMARMEPSYRSFARFVGESRRFAAELRRREVDLVHCAEHLGAAFVGYAARIAGIPLLSHVRNRFPEISRRDGSFLWPVDRFAFVSKDTWKRFGHRVPDSRGTVVYEAIDVDGVRIREGEGVALRRELSIPEGVKLIGMVARVAPQKDLPTLVRAAARVVPVRQDVRFLIVGDHSTTEANREYYREVRAQIEEAGLAPYFLFTGHRSDVPRILGSLDLFVLSSHWEGMPVVLLEAMAHARAVVATEVDGVPELIAHGRTGLLFPPRDAEAFAERMLGLLGDPDRARVMGEAAREEVATRFGRERFVQRIGELYSELLRIETPRAGRPAGEVGRRGAGARSTDPVAPLAASRAIQP